MHPTPFQCSTAPTHNVRAMTQGIYPFSHNLIFQYTKRILFETEPHSIHTILLLREHLDSYLHYIRYRTYEKTPSPTQFQVIFKVNLYRTIYPQIIQLTIQDVFNIYINKLIEFNENLDTTLYRPS